jgi:hypothetical protein
MFDEQPDRYAVAGNGARRWLPALAGIGVFVALGAVAVVLLKPSGSPSPRPHQERIIAHITLPPPPLPPPVKPPPDTAKKEPEKPKEVASPQKATVPKAAPKALSPPAALTTSIAGPGPGTLAAGNGGGGGDCLGSGCGTGDGGGGDNDAYYAGLVRSQTEAAIKRDERLRFAKYHARVALMLDSSGHVARATIQQFQGSPDDEAVLRQVLQTISTNDSPPADILHKTITLSIGEHV